MGELDGGTVTFLFTDIEGSTKLLRALGDRYPAILLRQRELIVRPAEASGGHAFGTEGDAVFLAFHDPVGALVGAAAAQRSLAAEPWPEDGVVRVRMGIHTGQAARLGDDFVGLGLHETARVASAGNGGQVLVSAATAELARHTLPADLGLRDLGDHRLKDLSGPQRLFQLTGTGLRDGFPVLRSLEGRPNNLPAQLTSFVGREIQAQAVELMARSRILTLTGPGGTGKTRLALQVGVECLDSQPDGVFFVPLETVTDPGQVPAAILAALDVRAAGGQAPIDRLLEHLRERRLLLILDNLEQVVTVGPMVARLLREAPGLRSLATSRIPLRISGEQELPVPPLILPDGGDPADSEAVRLFVERALAVQPAFRLDEVSMPLVADIVRRLDGLPLAIELAAARTRTLSVDAIRSRLDRSLGLLTGGARDLPARQQTLRAAIDWSHDLLTDPERRLYARLGVFQGGIDADLVESICGDLDELGLDPLDGLESLAAKSLLRPVPGASPRYAMLATIREHALERLAGDGDAARIGDRHAASFMTFAEQAAPHLTSADARAWLDGMEREHDNLRAAIDHAVARGDAATAMRIVTAMWRFWQIRGHLHEAEARFARVLVLPGATEVSAMLRARTLGAAGGIAYWRADYPAMRASYLAAAAEAERCGDPRTIADALYDLGFAPTDEPARGFSMYAQGVEQFNRALAIYRDLGDQGGAARSAWALGLGELYAGDYGPGRTHTMEALDQARAVGDRFHEAWSLWQIALFALIDRDLPTAHVRLREALDAFVSMGDRTGPMLVIFGFALVARLEDRRLRYWALRGAADRLRTETGADLVAQTIPALGWDYDERPASPEESAAHAAGLAMDRVAATAFALRDTDAV